MDNYYDQASGQWVTDSSRYEAVLREERFAPIREHEFGLLAVDEQWAMILGLLARVPEDTVPLVGAGPLEDFIHRHAPTFLDRIESELRRNPRLQRAVLEINLDRGTFAPAIEARIVTAFGPQF